MNELRRVVLQEYGEYTVIEASRAEIVEIRRAGQSWRSSLGLRREPFSIRRIDEGVYQLRAEGVAGIVRIGKFEFEIVPKFLNSNCSEWQVVFCKILAVVCGGIGDSRQLRASESSKGMLIEYLAGVFVSSFMRGSLNGLPRGYRTVEKKGLIPQGTLDLSKMQEFYVRPWEYPCLVDVLSMDTPVASLLKWAASRLCSMVSSGVMARDLRCITGMLAYVKTPTPHAIDARKLKLGVQYKELDDAFAIALMLLEGSGVSYAPGERALTGFLWNSDVVFENYMFWLCGQSAAELQFRVSKHAYAFGEVVYGTGKELTTIPDVVFKDSANCVVAVADAKYKVYGSCPAASDVYQVLNDAHVLGTRWVSLLYPVSHDASLKIWKVDSKLGAGEVYITMLPINLMKIARAGGISELVSSITHWLQNIPSLGR